MSRAPYRRRVLALGGVYLAILLLVWGGIALLMLGQHETWLSRSYQNRWAFKDVPSRRGAITDRTGRVIVQDQPSTALELHYWAFRRYHPMGAAVHGAELWHRKLGRGKLSQKPTKFTFEQPMAALQTCLQIPVRDLTSARSDRLTARDLRFYVCSLLSTLTNGSHGRLRKRLLNAAKERGSESVQDVLELDPARMGSALRVYTRELFALDRAVLRELGVQYPKLELDKLAERGLLGRITKAHGKYMRELEKDKPPRSDQMLVTIHARMPHELAQQIARKIERFPGLFVRASVSRPRSHLPGREDLASLQPFMGRVAPAFWRKDRAERDKATLKEHMRELEPWLESMHEVDPELGESQQRLLKMRAETAMRRYLRGHGRVGDSGAEQALEADLSGNPGLRLVERSRAAAERRLWRSFDVTPGQDVQLSFDLRLQLLLEQAMDLALAHLPAEQVAAMALLDPNSGEVLAMAGRPFDSKRLPSWWSWSSAGDLGSVVKPLVLVEQLDAVRHGREHRRSSEFRDCVGLYHRGLGCDHSHGSDATDAVRALGNSCNFYYYQAAEGLGGLAVVSAFARFGLNGKYESKRFSSRGQRNIDGLSWLQPQNLHRQDDRRRAIGYGVEANVLQVARAYAALATGVLREVTFLHRETPREGVALQVHPEDLQTVRDGLEFCVREGTATASKGFGVDGVLAKTGTATVGERGSKINNAWLAGYVDRDRPRLAFAAVVYKVKGYGGTQAGRLVRQFLELLDKDPVLREAYR